MAAVKPTIYAQENYERLAVASSLVGDAARYTLKARRSTRNEGRAAKNFATAILVFDEGLPIEAHGESTGGDHGKDGVVKHAERRALATAINKAIAEGRGAFKGKVPIDGKDLQNITLEVLLRYEKELATLSSVIIFSERNACEYEEVGCKDVFKELRKALNQGSKRDFNLEVHHVVDVGYQGAEELRAQLPKAFEAMRAYNETHPALAAGLSLAQPSSPFVGGAAAGAFLPSVSSSSSSSAAPPLSPATASAAKKPPATPEEIAINKQKALDKRSKKPASLEVSSSTAAGSKEGVSSSSLLRPSSSSSFGLPPPSSASLPKAVQKPEEPHLFSPDPSFSVVASSSSPPSGVKRSRSRQPSGSEPEDNENNVPSATEAEESNVSASSSPPSSSSSLKPSLTSLSEGYASMSRSGNLLPLSSSSASPASSGSVAAPPLKAPGVEPGAPLLPQSDAASAAEKAAVVPEAALKPSSQPDKLAESMVTAPGAKKRRS